MKRLLTAVVAATALLGGLAPAHAEYPTAPVQIIVPWPPGDFEDVLTRMMGEEAQTLMKETGARVYWQDGAASAARITEDRAKNADLDN